MECASQGYMALSRFALLVAASTALALTGFACASSEEGDDASGGEDNLTKGPNTDRWVYNGMLPHLEEPSIVVAQTPHTVRITGFLPASFDKEKLPFYAAIGVREVLVVERDTRELQLFRLVRKKLAEVEPDGGALVSDVVPLSFRRVESKKAGPRLEVRRTSGRKKVWLV